MLKFFKLPSSLMEFNKDLASSRPGRGDTSFCDSYVFDTFLLKQSHNKEIKNKNWPGSNIRQHSAPANHNEEIILNLCDPERKCFMAKKYICMIQGKETVLTKSLQFEN